jgi:serine/threonine protein kinase
MKENDLWICMEYCNIGSVAKVLKFESVGLNETLIAAISFQIVGALEYLHKSLLIHRDVK